VCQYFYPSQSDIRFEVYSNCFAVGKVSYILGFIPWTLRDKICINSSLSEFQQILCIPTMNTGMRWPRGVAFEEFSPLVKNAKVVTFIIRAMEFSNGKQSQSVGV
jgi:hypothetical protein